METRLGARSYGRVKVSKSLPRSFEKTSRRMTLRCGMMVGVATRLPSFLIRAPSARKAGRQGYWLVMK